ncbi:MAG: GIY-YIG nuclease family protein [Candidatus Pacebacteria bacterium]|nr:GIY-YIG nuclease family protein [Candidatus Paceibacterota bacterium]
MSQEKVVILDKKNKFLKQIPSRPGVYLFLTKKKEVLYVGRATFLNKRVLSYFQNRMEPRLEEMVNQAYFLKFIPLNNLLEAIILEANLIKKYWPKYNIREKDNRSFIYIIIPKKDFSAPFLVRAKELEKISPEDTEIFGPYKSLSLVKTALRIIRRIFPYSTCQTNSGRPCFDYQIGLCPGACLGIISKEEYQKNIQNIILLLKGEKKELIKKLKKENPDKIFALQHLEDVALIEGEEKIAGHPFIKTEGYDISHFSGQETVGAMVSFLNGKPDKKFYRLFKIRKAKGRDDLDCLREVLSRRFKHSEWPFPNLVLIDGGLPQVRTVENLFRELKIQIPLVGISKYQNDKLVFPRGMKKSLKELIATNKSLLLKVREEAHRFANSYRERLFEKKLTA